MKITRENISEIIEKLNYGFGNDHLTKIKKVLLPILNRLTGKTFETGSGGGYAHMFFQLEDFTWIGFHNADGLDSEITLSQPFKTSRSLETAFGRDEEKVFGRPFIIEKVSHIEYKEALETLNRASEVITLYHKQKAEK